MFNEPPSRSVSPWEKTPRTPRRKEEEEPKLEIVYAVGHASIMVEVRSVENEQEVTTPHTDTLRGTVWAS